jgi:GntP family gluconate:H+ symporter
MSTSFFIHLAWLLSGIAVIVLLTVKYRVHAFFALVLASFVVGLGLHLSVADVIFSVKDGFGNIMKSLGLIIVLGTTLGVLLEHTGSTRVMASFILRKMGQRHAALSMSITGFIIGLPIFCDSGYIVLSGLNKSLAKQTGVAMAVMATSLASGLYAVHCLIPPHPGAAAAAGIIYVDFGKLIPAGILTAIPATLAGYFWARYAGRKINSHVTEEEVINNVQVHLPSVINAFLPVIVPVFLIAAKSFITTGSAALKPFLSLGDPVIALSVGVLLAFNCGRNWNREIFGSLLREAADKAGAILVIIGAGGAFGAVLASTKTGEHLSSGLSLSGMGIWFPFLVAFVLKTAQGSSTVAIMTAASLVQPLLPALNLNDNNGRLLCVLSMGAGSMMISHANDAYFWVIAKFSGLEMKPMVKVYSVATIWMGAVSMFVIYILSKILL